MFSAMEIRDAIGQLADGRQIDPELVPFVRAAVDGPCPTSDQGDRQFVVSLDVCGQFNVDTEELIWPVAPDSDAGDDVSLWALTDRALWERARDRWDGEHPREWTAFVWRVAYPLSQRLVFTPSWH